MSLAEEVTPLIGKPESETLEYKAVLPPSRSIGQILCSFANTNGGYLVLGVRETSGSPEVMGLSEDFHASAISQKSVDLLTPKPDVIHGYVEYNGKTLFVVKVKKSEAVVTIEGKAFIRIGSTTTLLYPDKKDFKQTDYQRIESFSKQLDQYAQAATGAKSKFLEHYQSVLKIIDDLGAILYPTNPTTSTSNSEGKILIRILFSSCADNFETYLSDLLYEIYLANPNTLKSEEPVTINEVLNCTDLEEFVDFWAKKKLSKLQRGSVKGFIAENKQISALNAINETEQEELEKILQIRHLYAHKNGIVDEKFLRFYPSLFTLNEEHRMAIDSMIEKMEYLSTRVHRIDSAAICKFNLSAIS